MIKHTQEDCFVELDYTCTIREELFEYAKTITDWETATENGKYSFAQCYAPLDIIKKDPFLSLFNPRILKLSANTYYALHKDSYRQSAVNMLLSPCDSTTFFRVGDNRRNQYFICELEYKLDCLYVFNTQIKHAVLNKSSDRYMLSIGFTDSFENLVSRLTRTCQTLKSV